LNPDQLHPDLIADIELYLSIMSGTDPTHPLSPQRALRHRSIAKRRYEIHQLLAGMHHAGVKVGEMRRLADLCVVDLVRKGLTFHVDRYRHKHGGESDPRSSTMIGGIADCIRIIAKHYVLAPEPVVRELTAIASRFARRSNGMTERNRARLGQLESPLVLRKFLSHALIEMGKLARKPKITRMDAVRYATLLALEVLIGAPMRIENLAELDLDKHLIRPLGTTGEVIITVPRRSVKNNVPLEYKIPRGSMPAFSTYLKRFRPLLVKDPTSALFPGRRGRTKRSDSLSRQIKNLIRNELGVDWTPHVYRHLAARLYLRAYPGDYEGARRLLAHLSAETTYKFYEGEQMRPAVDRFDALIESIRDQDVFNAAFRNRYADSKKKG
jgi:integrase